MGLPLLSSGLHLTFDTSSYIAMISAHPYIRDCSTLRHMYMQSEYSTSLHDRAHQCMQTQFQHITACIQHITACIHNFSTSLHAYSTSLHEYSTSLHAYSTSLHAYTISAHQLQNMHTWLQYITTCTHA